MREKKKNLRIVELIIYVKGSCHFEQGCAINSHLMNDQAQYKNSWSVQYLVKVTVVTKQHYNKVLSCCCDTLAYKSCFADIWLHVCLIWPTTNWDFSSFSVKIKIEMQKWLTKSQTMNQITIVRSLQIPTKWLKNKQYCASLISG